MVSTFLGLTILLILEAADLNKIVARLTFKPPAVEPAHPPKHVKISKTILDNAGH